jgi:hypothetical protein
MSLDLYAEICKSPVRKAYAAPRTSRCGEVRFVTASVVDLFENLLGVMYNPHYLEVLGSIREV